MVGIVVSCSWKPFSSQRSASAGSPSFVYTSAT